MRLVSQEIVSGVEYLKGILPHYPNLFYPRYVSTKGTMNAQVEVWNDRELYELFMFSHFEDCKVSVFGIVERGRVDKDDSKYNQSGEDWGRIIFIDQDNRDKIQEVLDNIKATTGGIPLVIDSGSGGHILLPNNVPKMLLWESPDSKPLVNHFLLFAERNLSMNYCDMANHPTMKNTMVRVPGSINSKNGKTVRIVQKWDGKIADIRGLPFKNYIKLIKTNMQGKRKRSIIPSDFRGSYVDIILDRITPELKDGKKRLFSLVISPYLITIKGMSIKNARGMIKELFGNFLSDEEINYRLSYSQSHSEILPYALRNMKVNDPQLFDIVTGLLNDQPKTFKDGSLF